MLALKVHVPPELIVDSRTAAEAARMGVSELVREHLRSKNEATRPNRLTAGMPKSDYWADAADSVTSEVSGSVATVTVEKEGAALHYYGGVVYPKKKALAVPIDPSVAGIWPSEANALTDHIAMIWPKNSAHGFLKDTESGDLLWLLLPKATMKADASVLPTDAEIERAAVEAIGEAVA